MQIGNAFDLLPMTEQALRKNLNQFSGFYVREGRQAQGLHYYTILDKLENVLGEVTYRCGRKYNATIVRAGYTGGK